MVGRKQNKREKQKPHEMPGSDYGIDRAIAVVTATDFNSNLRTADVVACAYGEKYNTEMDTVLPILTLVATKPDFLIKAFTQFKGWIDATGPDALKVEILYSGAGYYISFGPEYQNAMWRTVGVDQLYSPIYWGLTYIKTIDTRNAILDRLAGYSKHPVASVILGGARFTGNEPSPRGPRPDELEPIAECPELLLLHLPVYKTPSEVPRFSGLMTVANPNPKELRASREEFESRAKTPASVLQTREQRLASLMPVTMHMLRNFTPLRANIDGLATSGVERWQIEQAIVNQRLWSLTTGAQRARLQNANDRFKALQGFVELDSPTWTAIADDHASITNQILRDARALLKGIGARAPATLPECQAELRRLGYLTQAEPPA
jgi:hypothetical protein